MLVGRLECGDGVRVCDDTGGVCLVHDSLWKECGNVVVLHSYHLVTENVTTYDNLLIMRYIHPLSWTTLLTSGNGRAKHILYFVVTDKNSMTRGDAPRCAKALVHDDPEAVATRGMPTVISLSGPNTKWYHYLQYDQRYSLSSPSPLPVGGKEIVLTDEHCLSVSDSASPLSTDVLDVSDVIRTCTPLLPR